MKYIVLQKYFIFYLSNIPSKLKIFYVTHFTFQFNRSRSRCRVLIRIRFNINIHILTLNCGYGSLRSCIYQAFSSIKTKLIIIFRVQSTFGISVSSCGNKIIILKFTIEIEHKKCNKRLTLFSVGNISIILSANKLQSLVPILILFVTK